MDEEAISLSEFKERIGGKKVSWEGGEEEEEERREEKKSANKTKKAGRKTGKKSGGKDKKSGRKDKKSGKKDSKKRSGKDKKTGKKKNEKKKSTIRSGGGKKHRSPTSNTCISSRRAPRDVSVGASHASVSPVQFEKTEWCPANVIAGDVQRAIVNNPLFEFLKYFGLYFILINDKNKLFSVFVLAIYRSKI